MFEFPKTFRLLKKQDFQETLKCGFRVVCPELVVIGTKSVKQDTSHKEARLGLIVSRKVGGAVVRNRVKRSIRESFRHIRPTLWSSSLVKGTPPPEQTSSKVLDKGLDIVVIARAKAGHSSSTELSSAFEHCINRLARKIGNRS